MALTYHTIAVLTGLAPMQMLSNRDLGTLTTEFGYLRDTRLRELGNEGR